METSGFFKTKKFKYSSIDAQIQCTGDFLDLISKKLTTSHKKGVGLVTAVTYYLEIIVARCVPASKRVMMTGVWTLELMRTWC